MEQWRTVLLGDNEWTYLIECMVRSVAMFFVVLLLFKLTGKKEIRQFSVLELIVVIGLGSAVGDPMLHPDAPILPAVVAIGMVLLLYRVMNAWTNRSPWLGRLVEGEVRTVFSDGHIHCDALRKEGLSAPEFFGELRVQHVEHLGQVRAAHMEVEGELSVFFLPDAGVRPGLPIDPALLSEPVRSQQLQQVERSCTHCGHTVPALAPPVPCSVCTRDLWVAAVNGPRIT